MTNYLVRGEGVNPNFVSYQSKIIIVIYFPEVSFSVITISKLTPNSEMERQPISFAKLGRDNIKSRDLIK